MTAATYVLIHGAGDVGWYWHMVEAELHGRGHELVVMDLPVDDDSAGLSAYADVVVEAIGEHNNLVVVAQSFGGLHRTNRLPQGRKAINHRGLKGRESFCRSRLSSRFRFSRPFRPRGCGAC